MTFVKSILISKYNKSLITEAMHCESFKTASKNVKSFKIFNAKKFARFICNFPDDNMPEFYALKNRKFVVVFRYVL